MIKDILDDHVKATQRVFEGREKSVGASEIGGCARRTYFTKSGTASDVDYPQRWGAMTRGTLIEDLFWQPAMRRRYKRKLLYSGKQQRTLVQGKLSATPDGLVVSQPRDALKDLGVEDIGEDGCFVVECKSIDPRVDLQREKQEHAFQVQVQLGLFHTVTDHRPEYALISYVDASFLDDVSEFIVKRDPNSFEVAKVRAEHILSAKRADDVRPEGLIAGGKECEYCPHAKQCGVVRTYDIPASEVVVDAQRLEEITQVCRRAAKQSRQRKSSEAEYLSTCEDIKVLLRAAKTKKIPGVVTWIASRGRASYDNKAIKEALAATGVDVEIFSKAGDPSEWLLISPKIMKEDGGGTMV